MNRKFVFRLSLRFSLICLIGLAPSFATGATITGHSLTWMGIFDETVVDEEGTFLPLYEHLALTVRDFEVDGLSLHLAGYARHQLSSNFAGDVSRVEMTYGYLDYTTWDRRFNLRAGRQHIFAGVTSEYADALVVQLNDIGDFGCSLFGGLPVLSIFEDKAGDSMYGGRAYYELFHVAEIGASALYSRENNDPDRFNLGLDYWVDPVGWLDVSGHLFYDFIYNELYDIAVLGRFRPTDDMRISVRYNGTTPSAFISKSSVLSVFSNEEVQEYGGSLHYYPGGRLAFRLDYSFFDYDTGDDAHEVGGQASYRCPNSDSVVGLGASRTDAESNGYTGVRLFVRKGTRVEGLYWDADVYTFFYDEEVGGKDYSINAALDCSYRIKNNLEVVGAIEYSTNPIFDEEVRAILKLTYDYYGILGR